MGVKAGVISIDVDAGTAKFLVDMDAANVKLQNFGKGAKESGIHVVTSMQASSAAIRELSGGSNVRAIEKLISLFPTLSKAVLAAFPAIAGIALGVMLVDLGKKAYEFFKKMEEAPQRMAEAFRGLSAPLKLTNDELALANARLANDIAKLEGKPQNGLAVALDETRVFADKLADSLDKDLDRIHKVMAENKAHWWQLQTPGTSAADKRDQELRNQVAQDAGAPATQSQDFDWYKKKAENELLDAMTEKSRIHNSPGITQPDSSGQDSSIARLKAYIADYQGEMDRIAGELKQAAQTGTKDVLQINKEAQHQATELLRKSDEDNLALQQADHQMSVADLIQYWGERLRAEKDNADRVRAIHITMGHLFQEQDKIVEASFKHDVEVQAAKAKKLDEWKAKMEATIQELDELDRKVITEPAEAHAAAQTKIAEVTAKGSGQSDDLRIEGQKLAIERAYGLEARHTAAEQISYLRQIAALDERARQAKIAGLVADQQIAAAEQAQFLSVGEKAKADEDGLKIANLQVEIDVQRAKAANDLYLSNTKILDVLRQQGMAGYFWKMNAEAKTATQIAQDGITSAVDKFSDDLAKMMSDPKHAHPAKMLGDTLKGLGQEEMKESIKAGLQRSLGTLFGKAQVHKPTGNPGDPVHVVDDTQRGTAGPAGVKPLNGSGGNSPLPGYGKVFGGASGVPGVFNLLGSGGGMPFGGALAGGGDVDPGTAYIVGDGGESEVFTPGTSGRVTPMSQMGGGDVHYHIDARGSTDPTLTAVNVKRAILAAHADAVTTGVLLNQEQQKRSVQG
jgi:hypothetical protein